MSSAAGMSGRTDEKEETAMPYRNKKSLLGLKTNLPLGGLSFHGGENFSRWGGQLTYRASCGFLVHIWVRSSLALGTLHWGGLWGQECYLCAAPRAVTLIRTLLGSVYDLQGHGKQWPQLTREGTRINSFNELITIL